MGRFHPGSPKKAMDPLGIPSGSHADPDTLAHQSAARLVDQLVDALHKPSAQGLHIERVLHVRELFQIPRFVRSNKSEAPLAPV